MSKIRFSAEKAEALVNNPESLREYINSFKDYELPYSPYCMERMARVPANLFEIIPRLYMAAHAL